MRFQKKNSFSYCGDKIPNPVTLTGKAAKKGLKVLFTSDKKKQGSGAQCTAICLDGAVTTPTPTTTTTTPTTTPTTTTPKTTTTTSATTTTLAPGTFYF